MDIQFNKELRSALIIAAKLDFADVLSKAGEIDISFSKEYMRKMALMLANPFGYVKKRTRPLRNKILRTAASFLLVLSLGLGALMLIPEVRAEVVRVVIEWLETHTSFRFSNDNPELIDISSWYPSYVPEGFNELFSNASLDEVMIIFTDGENEITYICFPIKSGIGINIDNEHSEEKRTTVNGVEAALYVSTDELYPSYLFWTTPDEDTGFLISSTLDVNEIIKVAESVSLNP